MKEMLLLFVAHACNQHVICDSHTVDELYKMLDAFGTKIYKMDGVISDVEILRMM